MLSGRRAESRELGRAAAVNLERNTMFRRSAWIGGVMAVWLALPAMAQWTWTPQTGRWVNLKRMPKESAELQLEYARSLKIDGDYRRALKETDKFRQFYANDSLADENEFLRGEILLAMGKRMDAAKTFRNLLNTHPDTRRFDEAVRYLYQIGDEYYESGMKRMEKRFALFRKRPLKRAAEVYGMVVENQPFTAAAAEAQYKIGLSHQARKEYIEAAYEFRRVIEEYGGSDWVDDASFSLASSYVKGALKPEYDQSPSELAVEAIDDFIAWYPDDPRNEDLRAKRAAMRESIARQKLNVARYYERRREFGAAKLYYELIADSFADTPQAETARAWLDKNSGVAHVGDRYTSRQAAVSESN